MKGVHFIEVSFPILETMRSYSVDLRQKIIDAYENKEGSIRQLAQRFKVAPSCVHELLQHYRRSGTVEPKPHAGGPEPKIQAQALTILQELVQQDNDATLSELAQRLYERTQIQVSPTTIHRSLKKLKLTRKKKTFKASEAKTDRVQQLRCQYWLLLQGIPAQNLIFLDETGINLAMSLLYGLSTQGLRAYSDQPKNKGKNTTVIGVIALSGLIAAFSFAGALDGDIFIFFVEQMLVPQLWKGAVVVMDNLPTHKVEGVRAAIEAVGARLIYLSPYSPDFNPIENCWSKVKNALRKLESRTQEALDTTLTEVLKMVSLEDIFNWFSHCCYCTPTDSKML
jgi:transposase/transposase-like protein